MAIKIHNYDISDTPWEEVDKTALANALEDSGDEDAIREAFAYVPDLEKHREWGGPHHELQGDTLVVNRHGVYALAGVLAARAGAWTGPKRPARPPPRTCAATIATWVKKRRR